jgi:hypothetical protein
MLPNHDLHWGEPHLRGAEKICIIPSAASTARDCKEENLAKLERGLVRAAGLLQSVRPVAGKTGKDYSMSLEQ